MREVACHSVGNRIEHTRDLPARVLQLWGRLRWDGLSLDVLQQIRDEILDDVALRALEDPSPGDDRTRAAVSTAAECAWAALDFTTFPSGDFELCFPLIGERLSNFPEPDGSVSASLIHSGEHGPAWVKDLAPASTRTWLDAFAMCLVGDLLWERMRAMGPMLRDEYATTVHEGAPYSPLECTSDPAELTEMDALCLYLAEATGPTPNHFPDVPLRKPTVEERLEAARRLDTLDALTSEQRLLRVLLDDNRASFEDTLVDQLVRYRESAVPDAPPRSLLPIGIIAVAALAVQVHGWTLGITSGYLPEVLLAAPHDAPPVAAGN
ncbi:immunity 49 family protein [Nocardia sp. NPDC051750]|uniref:immunity 49 family protein n=1 Tax=Nocardia sp. NPDC051750 TaxID=3364325 RepID=UPI0037A14036